jgi:hypothetical protein
MTYSFRLEYEDAAPIEASSEPPNGVRFEGEKGWIFVDRQKIEAEPANLLSATFGPGDVRLQVSPGHQRNFVDCIFSRAEPIVPAETGHRSITACHLANISMRLGRPVRWDPSREIFPGDDEANRWISRPMRAPWRLG